MRITRILPLIWWIFFSYFLQYYCSLLISFFPELAFHHTTCFLKQTTQTFFWKIKWIFGAFLPCSSHVCSYFLQHYQSSVIFNRFMIRFRSNIPWLLSPATFSLQQTYTVGADELVTWNFFFRFLIIFLILEKIAKIKMLHTLSTLNIFGTFCS